MAQFVQLEKIVDVAVEAQAHHPEPDHDEGQHRDGNRYGAQTKDGR